MTRLELAQKRTTAADFAKPHMSDDAKYIVEYALKMAKKDQDELLEKAKKIK